MAVDPRLEIVGLATDPNAHAAGRRGALRRAEHIVVDLPGVARPRPFFDMMASGEKLATSFVPRSIRRFAADLFAVSYDGATWRLERIGAVLTGEATPPDFAGFGAPQWLEARESLYHTSSAGLRKVESAADVASSQSGIDFVAIYNVDPAMSGAGGPFTSPATWATRLIGVKKDTHGYIRRSAPSTRVVGAAAGGTKITGGDRVYFSGLAAGDKIEAYRTRMTASATATPAADHYLAWTYVLTSTDITNRYFLTPEDVLADDDLGAAAYSNPSREGIVAGKEPPPLARALALFERCAWFGNTASKHRLELSIIDVGGSGGIYRTDTGVQCRHFTGDFTSGNPAIANVASVTGLVVGQALTDNTLDGPTVIGTNIPADTKILSITGAGPFTVTMDRNAIGTALAAAARACDVLLVGGVEFYAWTGPRYAVPTPNAAPRCFFADDDADYSTRIGITATTLYRAISHYGITNPTTFKIKARVLGDADYTNGQAGQLVLEEVGVGGAAFTVSCPTRPLAWTPQLVTAQTSENDRRPGRLWWSDPDEPEAVPLLNFVDIGSQIDPILALTPLETVLLVWKRDGVYRVSGTSPSNWRVDAIDKSLRLLRPECVAEMDGVAYAWTNRGLVAVTGTGWRSISEGLIDAELGVRARQILNDLDEVGGAFVVCNRQRRLVLVGTPGIASSSVTETFYVWSAVTQAWSTWPIASRCGTYGLDDDLLYLSRGDQNWEIRVDSGPKYDGRGYDRAYSPSAWTATAGSVTLTLTSGQAGQWIPKRGDWISADIGGATYYLRVLAASFSAVWTLTLESPFPAGAVTKRDAYEGVVSLLEWQALGGAAVGGIFRELNLQLHGTPEDVDNLAVRIALGARSDITAAVYSANAAPARPTALSRPIRAMVSRQVARASHFYPSAEINELFWAWRVSGLVVAGDIVSERVRR